MTEPTEPFDLDSLPDTRVMQRSLLTVAQKREGLAFHEAAHALVGMTYGMSLARVRLIETEADGPAPGLIQTGATTWNPTWVAEFAFAVQCAAGPIAERRHLAEAGLLTADVAAQVAGDNDRDVAVATLARSGYELALSGPVPQGGATWDQVTERAREDVSALWPEVAALAEALLTADDLTITPADVLRLTGRPNPAPGTPPASPASE
ncbi:hypothetical protein OG352_39810 (plasmid) [Streptomyces sp. NBC_01485]|uniref:hypothetical protein n=1 Tax=Streptomyces sp. NBC_01485 TaxID=2903884 RepID=UPI002E346B77|nr:hypothetical protein [Streptomyces sp. NBC_01485]